MVGISAVRGSGLSSCSMPREMGSSSRATSAGSVRARSVADLERIVERFAEVGRTGTAIALSTYVEGKPVPANT